MGGKQFVIYYIKGRDSNGEVDVARRYREFLLFYEMLFSRYPGLYVPPVPGKQFNGNKEENFVEERRHFLDVFLKRICQQKYLACTPEVQVFLRPKGTVIQSLKSLERATTSHVLKYYQIKIPIANSIEQYGENKMEEYTNQIRLFVKEQKTLLDHLKKFKVYINNIVPLKEQELRYYKQFAGFLAKYEDGNEKGEEQSSLGNKYSHVKIISGESKSHLKNKLDQLSQELKNPFKHIRNWIKGEMMNLESLMAAIGEKEACAVRKSRSIKLLQEERELINKINQNKMSLKTILKSQKQKAEKVQNLLISVDQREKDIENWDRIKKFLIVYLAEIAIPYFKDRKIEKYICTMQAFSMDEMTNAEKHLACWGDFRDLTDIYMRQYVK